MKQYSSKKISNFSALDKLKLCCDYIDGTVLNGVRKTNRLVFFW